MFAVCIVIAPSLVGYGFTMIDLGDLLRKTSRTFALAIPLLPEPTQRAVSLAYLVFRIADTLEDATEWERADRVTALGDLATALGALDVDRLCALRDAWMKRPPTSHAGYLELLEKSPDVLREIAALDPRGRDIVVKHAVRTTEGMARIVSSASDRGELALASITELREYCYVVAGIVGELLTDLFLNDTPRLESERETLEATMRLFGEGLQLVNILKDERTDAGDGRSYVPHDVPRADVLALARTDLQAAERYVEALRRGRAPRGYIAFTGLCMNLAKASLDRIEESGAGAKLSRSDVFGILGTTR